jgi:hypothetical protein
MAGYSKRDALRTDTVQLIQTGVKHAKTEHLAAPVCHACGFTATKGVYQRDGTVRYFCAKHVPMDGS